MITNVGATDQFQRIGSSHHLSFVVEQAILTFRISKMFATDDIASWQQTKISMFLLNWKNELPYYVIRAI